jgi:phosphate transport system substrate-binding protein
MAISEKYQALHPEIQISVSGTGTGEGIKSLTDGVIDIAAASRDVLPAESKRAEKNGVVLIRHTIALDSLAVIVNPDNSIGNLTLDQLEKIYVGEYHNWKELGGADRPIIAINRDSSSGTFEMWLNLVLHGKHYRRDAQVQPSGGGVAYAVGGNRNAIGYVGLGFLSPRVKAITVDGISPSPENVAQHLYPLTRELYLFTVDPTPKAAEDFLDFIKSERGLEIISAEGFLPPPGANTQGASNNNTDSNRAASSR